jgi:hypothetical protein
VTSRAWMVRLAALMGAGTFAVHQARYALGYRDEASGALAAQGHAYLIAAGPLLAGAVMLVVAELIRRTARGGAGAPAPRFKRLWACASLGLFVTYAVQESVEGALAAHHPAGGAGVLGHGGWLALPLAILVGLAIALAMRGASAATSLGAPRRPWRAPLPAAPRTTRAAHRLVAFRGGAALAHGARGPPLLAL